MSVQRIIQYALPPQVGYGGLGGGGFGGGGAGGYGVTAMTPIYEATAAGTILNVTPTIAKDKKNVLLNISTQLQDFLGFETSEVEAPVGIEGEVVSYTVKLPQTETSMIETRVSVPDSGTLLLGGQKITKEVEVEAGVPILSKIPIIGRIFSNRSKVKDHKVLLILVKPTIILKEEAEAKAVAAMESTF